MKGKKIFGKAAVLLLSVSISVLSFTGCQSKKQTTGNSNRSGMTSEQMKERVEENIKSLVTDGTITQAQADKIAEAYSNRTFGGGQNSQKNNQQNSQQNKQQSSQQNSQNRGGFNPLSQLVSDGVITQAQADAVTEKMRGNFTRQNNNGQTSQTTKS